jgi:hypothetical protein
MEKLGSSQILFCPPDHRRMIYQQLEIEELLTLAQVSKFFYQDNIREEIIIQKIIDKHFYITEPDTYVLKKYYVWLGKKDNIWSDKYFQKLENIKFNLNLNKNKFNQHIYFPIDYFLYQSLSRKEKIILNIKRYLLDLWKYAEKNKQDLFEYDLGLGKNNGFPFSNLRKSLESILKNIFSEDNSMKPKILETILDLENITKNSQFGFIEGKISSLYHYNPNSFDYKTNKFDSMMFFIESDNYDCLDLDKIVPTADFLIQNFDYIYTYHYLRDRFYLFLDLDDYYYDKEMDYMNKQIGKPYNHSQSFGDKLMELFTLSNYNVQEEFQFVIQSRNARLKQIYDRINPFSGQQI